MTRRIDDIATMQRKHTTTHAEEMATNSIICAKTYRYARASFSSSRAMNIHDEDSFYDHPFFAQRFRIGECVLESIPQLLLHTLARGKNRTNALTTSSAQQPTVLAATP